MKQKLHFLWSRPVKPQHIRLFVNPATGKQSFTGLMSEQQELKVGKEEHPKILSQFGWCL